MVKYIFTEGRVYSDDGGFTPIPRRRISDFASYGLLILLESPGMPVIAGQEGPDVYSRREEH